MIRTTIVCGLLAMAGIANASAEEFPLTFRTIPAKDVIAFPGGYGTVAQLRLTKPAKLKKEPKAISSHPLYGESRDGSGGPPLLLRLDESKGDGKGYDQLIVDMNQNGDLTDDTPAPVIVLATDRRASPQVSRQKLYGPIPAPAGKLILGERPMYFAQAYVNDVRNMLRAGRNTENLYMGYVRLKAGWYVDTTVELKGVKQKVGLFDANSNMRLGDLPKAQTYRNAGEDESWYFSTGDSFLIDADGSGAFERDVFDTESCAFSSVIYFGAAPYHVSLTPDGKALNVEPWTAALAEVTLQPHGEQVCCVTLAWEQPDKQWQLIRAGVADGKITVPPGNYRLYHCDLVGKGAPRDQVRVAAYQRVPKEPFVFAAGKGNTLRCGAPLEIKVAAEKKIPQPWEVNRNDPDNRPGPADSEYVVSINANICGAGGEVYSEYGKGEKFKDDPPKPAFTVTDSGGRKVGSGNLEFG